MRTRLIATVAAFLTLAACGVSPSTGRGRLAPSPSSPRAPTTGSAADGSTAKTSPTQPADPVELERSPTIFKIKQRGTLLIGLRTDAPRFVQRQGSGYMGFDVRMAGIIAQGLGLDPTTQIAFRRLPGTLRSDALIAGGVDVLMGGVRPGSRIARVGPYVVSGSGEEYYLGVRGDDSEMRERMRAIISRAINDGRWRRACEATLNNPEVCSEPPNLNG